MGKVFGGILTTLAIITAGLGLFSACVPFGMGSFFLNFFQVIEIISRLGYINVNFGVILTAMLEGLYDAIGLPDIPDSFFYNSGAVNVFPDTKGKLTYYEVSTLVLSKIPIFCCSYIVSFNFNLKPF